MAFLLVALNFSKPAQYRADLSFMLNDDGSNPLGGLSSMLGQFGFGVGGSESNIDKIMELSRARVISQSVLFSKEAVDGHSDYLGNHLINTLKSNGQWAKKGLLSFGGPGEHDISEFNFTHDSISGFDILENKSLKSLYGYLVGGNKMGGAFMTDYSEMSGIMNFHVTTSNPELSIDLVNKYYDELNAFYFEKAREKQMQDYNLVKTKHDSITAELKSVQYALADFEDRNRNLFRKVDNLKEMQLRGNEMKLIAMMQESEKQLQITQLALENKAAYIQLIDRPLPPLRPINKGRIYYFLFGGFLGGLLSIGFLLLKRMYQQTMA